jgi:dTDP-4-dehydrorhamnose 3,5-epimerase
MKFTPLSIHGAWLIEIEKKEDDRGFFARAYDEKEFMDHGIAFHYSQTNVSQSKKAGTIRGLHFQEKPYAEAKLMRCIRGSIFDAMIDLRKDSPTYGQTAGVTLTADSDAMVFIPAYCAHGHQTLEDDTEVLYTASSPYTPNVEHGIRWNDPQFSLQWPIQKNITISEKDATWQDFPKLDIKETAV